ncbi:ABC transporter permease subunit [Acetobacter sp. TBRC 12305]|uniref:ABC transporter permease subunit n=1 Tax=Acetobacter garciniae TaxID=2817435 RepID=A0A939KQL8_9PROT|nr:ABC transporter permease subunit [Acetobacter garciniae]MBO1325512.1 ABC transporter permease subunit [Acetobacter garciniae]MBX0345316.1 ABC transporter permease subunit [Acetobacter garciniae]
MTAIQAHFRAVAPPVVLMGAVLVLWQVACWAYPHPEPGPVSVAATLLHLMGKAYFWHNAAATGRSFLLASGISIAVGGALGLLIGSSRLLSWYLAPLLMIFQTVPKITLYPIVLELFGLGMAPKVAFGVMHGVIPVYFITSRLVAGVRKVLLRSARVMRLGAAERFYFVIVPAILPDMIATLRVSVALCLLGVLIGEMFASHSGLGFMAVNAINLGDTPVTLAVGFFLAFMAVGINTLLLYCEHKLRH